MLASADDLGGKWDLILATKNGHVPDLGGWGPQPFSCNAAGGAPNTPVEVSWHATHAFEFAGRATGMTMGHEPWVYHDRLDEYLLAGSARATRRIYDAFATSMKTCASSLPGSRFIGQATALDLPAIGDARTGIDVAWQGKGRLGFIGDARTVLVLDGTVLLAITLDEMDYPTGEPWRPEPQIDEAELSHIVEVMVDHLH